MGHCGWARFALVRCCGTVFGNGKAWLSRDYQRGIQVGKGSVSGGVVAIPILERALSEVENVAERTPLFLEAMFRLYQGLTEAYKQGGEHQKAIAMASEAIKYAKALGLKGGLQAALQMLATTYFVAGDTERALAEYDALIQTPGISKPVLGRCLGEPRLAFVGTGDDDAAMHSLEDSGDRVRVQACRQYILCSTGRGGLEGEVLGGSGGMPLEFVFHTTMLPFAAGKRRAAKS